SIMRETGPWPLSVKLSSSSEISSKSSVLVLEFMELHFNRIRPGFLQTDSNQTGGGQRLRSAIGSRPPHPLVPQPSADLDGQIFCGGNQARKLRHIGVQI